MTRRKVSFETLGCRFNQFETAEMAHEMEKSGFAFTQAGERSDVVVINTCAVTAKSGARCRAAIRKAREEHPGAEVVVTGCYSETSPDAVAGEDGVSLVLGNVEKFGLASALASLDAGVGRKIMVGGANDVSASLAVRPVTSIEGRTNAYIKAQSGCGEECSYCIVRVARGKSASADPDEIVAQIRRISEAGVKEIVFTGINLGEYRSKGGLDLAGLVRKTLDETPIPRIRLSSVNPQLVMDGLIELIASSPRVCRHLHVPLQSGSTAVLERMRRPYTAEQYEVLLNKLAEKIPGIGIGADVMVGFPGETQEDFEMTRSLIERSPIMALHIFIYSPRNGTEAFGMSGRPLKDVSKARSATLKKLSAEKRERAGARFVGQSLDVLVENTRTDGGQLKGFSDNYHPVTFDGPDELMNRIVSIRITEASGAGLAGEVS
jgi:threonylcarbamoyladenosine tRNA methylthiotransferase MtaB